MPLPYHVSCSEESPTLFELDDGRFQLMESGRVPPFVAGHRYVLIEPALADFLRKMDIPRIRLTPAVIWDPCARSEQRTHERLFIGQLFRSNEVRDLDLEGDRLLVLNDRYVFASPSLKKSLEAAGFAYLQFSIGLEGFAANAT